MLLTIGTFLPACGDSASQTSGSEECPQGKEGCSCEETAPFCQNGLKCLSKLCVDPGPESDPTTTTASPTTGGGDATSEASTVGSSGMQGDSTSTTGPPPVPMDPQVCAFEPVLLWEFSGYTFFSVRVNGAMSDANVREACLACDLKPACAGLDPCEHNDEYCQKIDFLINSCGAVLTSYSDKLCGTTYVPECPELVNLNLFNYMGDSWPDFAPGSSCGAVAGSWCADGLEYMDLNALCVTPIAE